MSAIDTWPEALAAAGSAPRPVAESVSFAAQSLSPDYS